MSDLSFAMIPQRIVGPIHIITSRFNELISVPLATFETPLWPSVQRGARVCNKAGGINVALIDQGMTRSVVVQARSVFQVQSVLEWLSQQRPLMDKVVQQTSAYCRLQKWHSQVVGRLLYLRFHFFTGDAAGHNMTTKAAEALLNWLLNERRELEYVSISANICADKKPQAINGLLGRGKYIVAETVLSKELCQKFLRTTPERLQDLNIKKNYIGSSLAGSIRAANAHYANMLLALYLATGQDAANIVEGSQGFTHFEVLNESLYCSVTLPNIIVGVCGNGKEHPFVQENLKLMQCHNVSESGDASARLAMIAGAVALCGELSLLAAQTNPGELVRSHLRIERRQVSGKE